MTDQHRFGRTNEVFRPATVPIDNQFKSKSLATLQKDPAAIGRATRLAAGPRCTFTRERKATKLSSQDLKSPKEPLLSEAVPRSDGPILSVSEPDVFDTGTQRKRDPTAQYFKPAAIVAVIILIVGIILMVPGLVLYFTDDVPDAPFVWSLGLCSTGNGTYIGMNVTSNACSVPFEDMEQVFHIPLHYVDINTPYRPFLLVSDKGMLICPLHSVCNVRMCS